MLQVLLNATVYAAAAATAVWVPLMLTSPLGDTLAGDGAAIVAAAPDPEQRTAEPPAVAPIFGLAARPDRPAADAPSAPEQAAAPPEYAIRGLVLSADRSWAILGGPGGDQVVSAGDVLDDGAFVSNIDADGVHLVIDGTNFLVGPEDGTRTVTRSAAPAPAPETPEREVVFRIGRLETAEVARLIARGGNLGDRSEVVGGIPVVWARGGEFLDRLGLEVGDVIVSVDSVPVPSLSDERIAQRAVQNGGRLVFEVRQGDERRNILVRFSRT